MLRVFTEAIRRLLALGCLLGGLWLILEPNGKLVVARLVDFEHDFATNPYFSSKGTTLEDFIGKRTSGRTRLTDATEWKELVRSMRCGTVEGFLQALGEGASDRSWVFRPGSLPEVPEGELDRLVYLSIPSEEAWVTLDPVFAQEIRGLDSGWVYPERKFGLILLALAFAFYFLVPRVRLPEESMVYGKGAAVVGPDLLGLLLGGFFFALPTLVIGESAPGQLLWASDGGWFVLRIALWTMAALAFSLVVVGYFYSTLYLVFTDEGLVVGKSFGSSSYAWDEMEGCSDYESGRGKIFGVLLVVLANSPGMVGQGLLVASNAERGLEIRMKSGRTLRVMANSFPGYGKVVEVLQKYRIKGSDALEF